MPAARPIAADIAPIHYAIDPADLHGHRFAVTLTIAEPILDRVDQVAAELGQSRAAVINLAIMQMLQSGLRIDGGE